MTERLLRLPQVLDRVGLSRSRIYEMVSSGESPKPIPLGARAVAWISSEIDEWIARRIKEARGAD